MDLNKIELIFVRQHFPAKTNYPPFTFISFILNLVQMKNLVLHTKELIQRFFNRA